MIDADAARASKLRALSGSRSAETLRLRRLDALAWAVLTLAVLLSCWLGHAAWMQARQAAQTQFEARADAVATAILTRMQSYEDLVRASAGMLESRPEMEQPEFMQYVRKLQIPRRHPGVHGLGFARRVPSGELPDYLLRQRALRGDGFQVHPASTAEEHMIIDLLYPETPGMRPILGTDVAAEAVRRDALRQARDSGELTAVRRLKLGENIPGQSGLPGFLLYAPVYARDLPDEETTQSRQTALRGYATAGFGWESVVEEALSDLADGRMDVRLISVDSGVVFDRRKLREEYGQDMRPAFHGVRPLEFFGSQWRVEVDSAPRQAAIPGLRLILMLSAGGIVLGLLVFALLRNLARADRRSRALLNAVADHLPALIAYIGADGRYGFVNRASEDWFPAQQRWSERSLDEVHSDDPEFLDRLKQAMQDSRQGDRCTWQARIGQPPRDAQICLIPDTETGSGISGWYLMGYDTSEQNRVLRELALARDHLQRVTDRLPAMIAQYDNDERAIFFNRACADAPFWERPYHPGIALRELLGEQGYAQRKPYLDAVKSGKDVDFEVPMQDADGRTHRIHSYYTPDLDEHGQVCGFFVMSTDVTEKARLENALHDAHERAEATLTSISDAVITTDADACVTYMNPAAEMLSGWRLQHALGHALSDILPLRNAEEAEGESALASPALSGDLLLVREDGKRILVERSLAPVRDRSTTGAGEVIVLRDVTEARALNSRMAHLAHHDALTSLPNRLQLNNSLGKLIDTHSTRGGGLAVLFIDLDLFKHVNDALGHHIGDQLLQQVARRIQRSVGALGSVYRTGGDEFVVLLDKVSSREKVLQVAERLLTVGEEPYTVSSHELHQAFSIGISVYPDDGHDASTLMMRADAAMYLAKRSGRNASRFHNSELANHADARIELENSLRRGLRKGELTLHYQPQIDAKSGSIIGVEGLIRWQKGDRLLMPGEFLPIAEETHLIVDIDRWAIHAACRQNRIWQQAGLPPIPVSVNIAAANFDSGKLLETVTSALHDTGMAAEYLELEVTETTIMQDVQRTDRILRALKAMGIRIAIDDFGTGFSSLSYLGNYGFNVLKIDQSFVREVTEPSQAAITRAIIGLANQLHCRTIAEGVETQSQLEWLVGNGCDMLQGHLFSPPIPPTEFARLLARNKAWAMPKTGGTQSHWS